MHIEVGVGMGLGVHLQSTELDSHGSIPWAPREVTEIGLRGPYSGHVEFLVSGTQELPLVSSTVSLGSACSGW